MKEFLTHLNKELKPYYSLLSMMVFFAALFISAYKFIISPSDLMIKVDNQQISYPNSIGVCYSKIHKFLVKKDTLQSESNTIYGFLIQTLDLKVIVLRNTSSKTLRGVKFKHLNIDDLTGWSISSDYLTNAEEQLLRKNLIFDQVRNIVYLNNVVEIPANSQIKIMLWGNFKNIPINNDLLVNYDNGEGQIEQIYYIGGLKGYFMNYFFEFAFVILLIFVVVYYIGIKYSKTK